MAVEYVLRISRSDSEGEYVLVNVTSPAGASALDLRLLATEGENPYVLSLKHSRIQKYRAKAGQLDEAQWEELLYAHLLRRPAKTKAVHLGREETLEVRAAITGEQLAIIFRKNVSGITQRLGEITLEKDEAQEVDAIAWAATAVLRCDDLEIEAEELKQKYEDQRSTIQDLHQQLEDLIEAKKQHEIALLEKFRDLLNAKKLKIRDQQRLLVRTKTGSHKAADRAQTARHDLLPRSPAASTPRKRKAKGIPSAVSASPTASDSDQSLEEAAVMQEREEPPLATPDRSDASATEDEDDDDDDDNDNSLDSVPQAQNIARGGHKPALPQKTATAAAARIQSPPPRRDLPFTRGRSANPNPKNTEAAAATATRSKTVKIQSPPKYDDDDETSDDEL